MRNPYDWYKDFTAGLPRTDLWRAATGVLLVGLLLYVAFGLAACTSVPNGPAMTLATSHRGDGFIRVDQNVWQSSECSPRHQVFFEYEHHSEIFRETNEDTYDGLQLGYILQFGDGR